MAIDFEGEAMAIGGFGPTMLVWPRLQDESLAGMNDDDFVYGVFAIESFSSEVG
jgi:hypothetical protein